jgi:IS66 C-terminal element
VDTSKESSNAASSALRRPTHPRHHELSTSTSTCAAPATTTAIFSLVASCRLHGIDPQQYLDEVMRALPDWPKERYLELSPKHWAATRSHLLPADLDSPLCSFTVPPAALNFAR